MGVNGPGGPGRPAPGFFQNLGQSADRAAAVTAAAGRFARDGGILGHTNVTPAPNGVNLNVTPQKPNTFGQIIGGANRVLNPVTNLFDLF